MAFVETDKLAAGELITGAFGELAQNRREILIYLGVFLLVDIASSVVPKSVVVITGPTGLLASGGYFLGQYLLYRAMLRRAGHTAGGIRIFRFVGMAIVIGFGLLFASYLFLIPAIVIAARWIAAPCYLVATDRGVFASLGESWSASSGSTLALSLAFTAMVLIFFALLVAFTAAGAAIKGLLGPALSFGFTAHLLPLLLMGLSVAAYRRLNEEGVELAAVFA
jgi:hypothetical protein